MPVEATETLCWIVVEGDCRFLYLSLKFIGVNIYLWDSHVLNRFCTSIAVRLLSYCNGQCSFVRVSQEWVTAMGTSRSTSVESEDIVSYSCKIF